MDPVKDELEAKECREWKQVGDILSCLPGNMNFIAT